MKKIAVFGCKSTTVFLLETLKQSLDISCVITITPEMAAKNQVADYTNLQTYCQNNGLDFYIANRYDLKSAEDTRAFKKLGLDAAFVIGWQRIIPQEILETFAIGVFGMHGSTDDLPVGRGRSPMNWALLEQRKHFFTNLFKYDPGVDSGDILDTFVFSIQPSDTAETMHYKNVLAMKTLITKNINTILSNELNLTPQKEVPHTFYPKRSPDDSIINWQQDIFQLEAFVRAVTKPFNGAFSFLGDSKIILWRVAIFETDLVNYGYRDEKFGTVIEVFPSGKFLISCRGGVLIVHDFEYSGTVVKGNLIKSTAKATTEFALNKHGYHDLEES